MIIVKNWCQFSSQLPLTERYLPNPRRFEGNSPGDAGENYTTGTRVSPLFYFAAQFDF